MNVRYEEKNGKLHYEYQEKDRSTGFVSLVQGVVPFEICKRGNRTVRVYVERAIREKLVHDRPRREAHIAFRKNPDVEVSVNHRGVLLRGKVIYANAGLITVRLDSPPAFRGASSMNFGFASAIAGHHVFEKGDRPALSRSAIEGAQTVLTWIYDEKKHERDHGDVVNLAKSLNR